MPLPEIKELYDWIDKYAETDDIQYVDKLLCRRRRTSGRSALSPTARCR